MKTQKESSNWADNVVTRRKQAAKDAQVALKKAILSLARLEKRMGKAIAKMPTRIDLSSDETIKRDYEILDSSPGLFMANYLNGIANNMDEFVK